MGILRAKQYTYFSFAVSSAEFPIDFIFSVTSAAALNSSLQPTLLPNTTYNASTYLSPNALLPYYYDAGSGPLVDMPGSPLVVASYATHGIPTATSLQFSSIPIDASGLVLGIHFSPGTESSFSQVRLHAAYNRYWWAQIQCLCRVEPCSLGPSFSWTHSWRLI